MPPTHSYEVFVAIISYTVRYTICCLNLRSGSLVFDEHIIVFFFHVTLQQSAISMVAMVSGKGNRLISHEVFAEEEFA